MERPYPRHCPDCGTDSVIQTRIPYESSVKHDGKLHLVVIPSLVVDQCERCKEVFFTNTSDEEISLALRRSLHLLSPNEIKNQIRNLGINQKQFAELLGVAAETVSRWTSGMLIQTRSLDNLMRLFFSLQQVRDHLKSLHGRRSDGNEAASPAAVASLVDVSSKWVCIANASRTTSASKWRGRDFPATVLSRCSRFSLIQNVDSVMSIQN